MMRFGFAAAIVGGCTLAAGCQQTPSPGVRAQPQQMPAYQQSPTQYEMQPQMQPQGSDVQQVPGGSADFSPAPQVQGHPQQGGSPDGQPLQYGNP